MFLHLDYARRFVGATMAAALLMTLSLFPGLAAGQAADGVIAFTRNSLKGKQSIDIWTVNPDGSGATKALKNGNFPSWAPNGTTLAFVRDTRRGGRDIFVQDLGARKAKQLTSDPGDETSPDWSPDGTQIVFERENDIWVMDANPATDDAVMIAGGEGPQLTPSWTPDGRILFADSAGADLDIWVMNADGTGRLQLSGEADGLDSEMWPQMSPDESQIVFNRTPSGQSDSDVWIMDSLGLNEQLLFAEASGLEHDDHPRWSPDGTRITFQCDINNVLDFDTDICVMTVNPSPGQPMTITGAGLDHRPDWGPAV